MFEWINLYTADGSLITTVKVPEFKPKYEILIWGQRTFLRDRESGKYKESSAYVVLLGQNGN